MTIARLVLQKGLTKYRLSKISGVPYTTLSDICSGKTLLQKCEAETIYKLATALDTTVEELLTYEALRKND